MITLCSDGHRVKKLVHRLVGEAFIDNPNQLDQINHIDRNTQNNRVENLEWCDAKSNVHYSYFTMPPTRNYIECSLYQENKHIKDFMTKYSASKYASENFGCSLSMIYKHGQNKGFRIIDKV